MRSGVIGGSIDMQRSPRSMRIVPRTLIREDRERIPGREECQLSFASFTRSPLCRDSADAGGGRAQRRALSRRAAADTISKTIFRAQYRLFVRRISLSLVKHEPSTSPPPPSAAAIDLLSRGHRNASCRRWFLYGRRHRPAYPAYLVDISNKPGRDSSGNHRPSVRSSARRGRTGTANARDDAKGQGAPRTFRSR